MNDQNIFNINNDPENKLRARTWSMEVQCNSSIEQNTSSSSSLSLPVGSLSIGTIIINELRSLNQKFTAMGDKIDRVGDKVELFADKMNKVADDIQSLVRFVQFGVAIFVMFIIFMKIIGL